MHRVRVKFSVFGFKHLLRNFRIGILSGFPLCCVLDFCLDDFMGKPLEKRHIYRLGYRPCRLCYRARKQTYQRAVTELFLETGYLENVDYWLMPNTVQRMVDVEPPTIELSLH